MLTPKQARFADEYIVDLNATQAAIRAGYSSKRADATGYENLRKPEIAAALKERMDKRAERTQINADWMLKRLAQDATADLAEIYDPNGNLLPVGSWPMAWRTGLVAGIDTAHERDGTDDEGKPTFVTVRKVRLADRTKLLELIGKHIDVGAFKDRIEHSGKIGLESLIADGE
ncbi:terminase small subunit [Thiobacillus denitrificans]|nr:terminase small subunit [Thiobacillus denitrificans]